MMEKWHKLLKNLEEEWVFPLLKKCSLCKRDISQSLDYGLCPTCREQLQFCPQNLDFYPQTDEASRLLKGRRSLFYYQDKGKDLMMNYKYFFQPSLAQVFADLWMEKHTYLWPHMDNPALTYVPATRIRERERGFDSTKLLAQKLAEQSGLPILEILEKRKQPQDQHNLSYFERWQSLKDVYVGTESQLNYEGDIIIIDDIYTTGATIHHCAQALREMGVKNIYSLTVAYTPKA